jgi:hypothetical protein
VDQDVSAELEQPPLGSVGADLYAGLAPLAFADAEHGWALLLLCEAVGRMWQEVDDLVREDDGRAGWSALVDVDRAPGAGAEIDALPWLAQLAGVPGVAALGDFDRREAIRRRSGSWRGTPDAIVSYAERFTDGLVGVSLRERFDSSAVGDVDAPYHGQVRIRRSRLLPDVDQTALANAILARVPAGLRYEVVITDERDFEQVDATWASFDAIADDAEIADFTDLLNE